MNVAKIAQAVLSADLRPNSAVGNHPRQQRKEEKDPTMDTAQY
jgi:hypothetical protein